MDSLMLVRLPKSGDDRQRPRVNIPIFNGVATKTALENLTENYFQIHVLFLSPSQESRRRAFGASLGDYVIAGVA